MSNFDQAIEVVLRHEGGLVDDSADPGGITNFGISLRWAQKALGYSTEDIRNLTRDKAKAIYRDHWWQPGRYGDINSPSVATKAFDMAVNMGEERAVKILQSALRDCGCSIDVDGKLGDATLGAVNGCAVEESVLLGKVVGRQADFYRDLARSRPSLAKFLPGWLHRAAWPMGSS